MDGAGGTNFCCREKRGVGELCVALGVKGREIELLELRVAMAQQGSVELLAQIRTQVELAERTLVESRIRFANAQIEYLDVITAIRTLQDLQRREIGVQRAVLANRARLLLAIGGDWTRDLTPPADRDATESNDRIATEPDDPSFRNIES